MANKKQVSSNQPQLQLSVIFENAIKSLKNSPTFALSSSSKELSHSNFWVWLFNENNKYIDIFFPGLSQNNKINRITREEGHRDITIWFEDSTQKEKAYVIENKLKSIPTTIQLDGYAKNLNGSFEGGIITGVTQTIKSPYYPPNCKKDWKFISYKNIAGYIRTENNGTTPIIDQYCNDIDAIYDVVNEYSNAVGQRFPHYEETQSANNEGLDNYYKALQEIRFDDICKKQKVSEFVDYLEQNIRKTLEDELISAGKFYDWDLVIRQDYYDKQALLDVRFVKKNDSNTLIGIQLQNYQYRRCAQWGKGVYNSNLKTQLQNAGWFFKFDKANKQLIEKNNNPHSTRMSKYFCRYDGSSYHFDYQHYTITDFTFDALKNSILADMLIAITFLDTPYFP